MLSHACWQKRFGSDPGIVSQTVILNNVAYAVVGVLPALLSRAYGVTDAFVSGILNSNEYPPETFRQGGILFGNARLKPGVNLERANKALRVLNARYRQTYPDHVNAVAEQKVAPFQELVVGRSRPMFYTLAGAVGCVLLIACVNVANLCCLRGWREGARKSPSGRRSGRSGATCSGWSSAGA